MTKNQTDIRILRKSNCSSLSGRSELTYEFGFNEKSEAIAFRIADNSGAGQFQDTWIPLDAIISNLEKAKEPFSLSMFKPLYSGQSINNTGFLGAALLKEGLIERVKRHYTCKNLETFTSEINALVTLKAAKKKPRSKK